MLNFGNYANNWDFCGYNKWMRFGDIKKYSQIELNIYLFPSSIAASTFLSMPIMCGCFCSGSATFRAENCSSTPAPFRRQLQRRRQRQRQNRPRMNQCQMDVAGVAQEYHQHQQVTANQINCHREWEGQMAGKSIRWGDLTNIWDWDCSSLFLKSLKLIN